MAEQPTTLDLGELTSALQTLTKLRERQRIGKYAEERAEDARQGMLSYDGTLDLDGQLKAEFWAGMAHAFRIIADKCVAEMPDGKWLPEDG